MTVRLLALSPTHVVLAYHEALTPLLALQRKREYCAMLGRGTGGCVVVRQRGKVRLFFITGREDV